MQPQLQKIILITIAVITIAGGGFVWFLLGTSTPSQNGAPQTQAPAGGNGSNNQTSVGVPSLVTGSQTQTQAQAFPDIEGAYRALFQKILAQSVVFVATDSSSTGVTAALYALYASDVKQSKNLYPSATNFSVGVALVDITDDGTPEALVYENLPGFCGSGGCLLDIYKKEQNKWIKLFSVLTGEDIGLSNTLMNGFLDLYLSVPADTGPEDRVVRYVWDGKQYNPGEVMAVWDGATFVTP